jgi:GT2 family glycosyltransferase
MKLSVVVPTINSIEEVKACIASLKRQSIGCNIIVVANGTTDGTQRYLSNEHPDVTVLSYQKPLGFAGAVNAGIRHALSDNASHVALLNNDAVADRRWLEYLYKSMCARPDAGMVTCKIKLSDANKFDSTGDYYTSWLLPYPRGRGVRDKGQYDTAEEVVSASGGASLYSVEMFGQVGLFDEDFFAYYEDIDICLRARHAGWRIYYEPRAVVDHAIGGTSRGIKGFTTLQTMKNLPLLYIKNVPFSILIKYVHGFNLAYLLFGLRAISRGQGVYALKGFLQMSFFVPKKLLARRQILRNSKLTTTDFDHLLVHDLPPNAKALRKLRGYLRRLK